MIGKRLFMYVVDRDFGFAPNPFHGVCTLATCKPGIRKSAKTGDWVVGMGGARLKATGHCVFAMRVGLKLTFNEYWEHPDFLDKRPVRNGSKKMLVGDNIYHRSSEEQDWIQENSHHSLSDGTVNRHNMKSDTQADHVLISDVFYYFGKSAPLIPDEVLKSIGYLKNPRGYRKFEISQPQQKFINGIATIFPHSQNLVIDDPFDFEEGNAHYDGEKNKVNL